MELYMKCPHCKKETCWIELKKGITKHRFRCPNCYKTFSSETTLSIEYSKNYNFKKHDALSEDSE